MRPTVAVLLFVHKATLEWYEEIALKQCVRVLGRHPIRLVCPRGLDVGAYRAVAPDVEPDFIAPKWLSSVRAYNRLKILPYLYRRYRRFDYVLTYELDAFVFRDELADWCEQGWDYVGAPWFEGYERAAPDAPPLAVGNSGFSLRRTRTMLRIASTPRYRRPAGELFAAWREGRCGFRDLVAGLTYRNNFFGPWNDFADNEDVFWGRVAARRFPDMRVAPHEVATRFSWEVNPSRLSRECGGRLPFGCHKWMTYEFAFWKGHIEHFGYQLPAAGAA